MTVAVSGAFRKMTIRAVFAIILFIFTYLLLFTLAAGLTFASGFAGFVVISAIGLNYFSAAIGIGLVSVGVLILYFLIKFLFKQHKVDRTDLTELTREEQPELFAFIAGIVQEVGTTFPKKIYLSSDVNAAVFYDSSFWSMFFPVRKNLLIGIGLINTVSRLELKAILAHEFGHFSQRSMKLGSYVYNANQVIYNMLYDNESFHRVLQNWANISNVLYLFANISVRIVMGIQWILKKNYQLLNLNYMGLSREMEFHADEVAANVAGSQPLITSLLRIDLSDVSLQNVFDYYNQRVEKCVVTNNLYSQQALVMKVLADNARMPIVDGLPQVTLEHLSKYSKSKLVIKDQWASHPSTKDRVAALNRLNIQKEKETNTPANSLLQGVETLQQSITARLFTAVTYAAPVVPEADEQFITAYREAEISQSFPDIFNGYYDRWNPVVCKEEDVPGQTPLTFEQLFGEENIELINTIRTLEKDKQTLAQLAAGGHDIKTFDYDGVKYKTREAAELEQQLEDILKQLQERAVANDKAVHLYFSQLASSRGEQTTWETLYQTYADADQCYEERIGYYNALGESIEFMRVTTPYEQIERNLIEVAAAEKNLKTQIRFMLDTAPFQEAITPEIATNFNKYLDQEWVYFRDKNYIEESLKMLEEVMEQYPFVLSKSYFLAKKALLDQEAAMQATVGIAQSAGY